MLMSAAHVEADKHTVCSIPYSFAAAFLGLDEAIQTTALFQLYIQFLLETHAHRFSM